MTPRIYIPNLPCKPDRRERLAAHLAELDLFPADRIRWVKALSGDWSPGPAWWKSGNGAWGQLTRDAQAHSGAVDGTTPTVAYEYDDGTLNHTRHTATVYPAGRRLLTEYESTGSYDHRLSRPTRLAIEGEAFPAVDYLYAGLSWIVRTLYPQNNVELRHFKLNNESNGDAGDPYRAFDRFGRLEEVRWRHAQTQGGWIEHLFYGYDKASLRTWKDTDAAGVEEDELFAYDGLYQVIQRQRGVLNNARTAITGTPERQEDFDFDPLGNWQAYTLRANGTPQADQTHTRTHNQANQITAIAQTGATPATIAHDFAGNMTKTAPDKDGDWTKGYNLKWDAWNRLVEVRRQEDDTHVATYHYDGLFRRTHSTVDGTDRHFLYDRAWRILEEQANNSSGTSSFLPNTSYFLWGLRHRTDMVCRDADLPAPTGSSSDSGETSGSTSTSLQRHYVAYDWISPTAILDPTTGDPVERYSFSAFGQRKIMAAGYGERAASEFAWNFAFHGEFEDFETGWVNYGYRYFNSKMGRWLARDPIMETAGRHFYGFTANSPLNNYDIVGLDLYFAGWNVSEYRRGEQGIIPGMNTTKNAISYASGEQGYIPGMNTKGRLQNAAAGAASGAAAGAATGAVVGAGVGALAAGVGAGPGAVAGATSGAIGGGVTGLISGFMADPETSALNVAIGAAKSGVVAGLTGGTLGGLIGKGTLSMSMPGPALATAGGGVATSAGVTFSVSASTLSTVVATAVASAYAANSNQNTFCYCRYTAPPSRPVVSGDYLTDSCFLSFDVALSISYQKNTNCLSKCLVCYTHPESGPEFVGWVHGFREYRHRGAPKACLAEETIS